MGSCKGGGNQKHPEKGMSSKEKTNTKAREVEQEKEIEKSPEERV